MSNQGWCWVSGCGCFLFSSGSIRSALWLWSFMFKMYSQYRHILNHNWSFNILSSMFSLLTGFLSPVFCSFLSPQIYRGDWDIWECNQISDTMNEWHWVIKGKKLSVFAVDVFAYLKSLKSVKIPDGNT